MHSDGLQRIVGPGGWIKFSGPTGNCVEVCQQGRWVLIRDSAQLWLQPLSLKLGVWTDLRTHLRDNGLVPAKFGDLQLLVSGGCMTLKVQGHAITFSAGDSDAFVKGIQAGAFDQLEVDFSSLATA